MLLESEFLSTDVMKSQKRTAQNLLNLAETRGRLFRLPFSVPQAFSSIFPQRPPAHVFAFFDKEQSSS